MRLLTFPRARMYNAVRFCPRGCALGRLLVKTQLPRALALSLALRNRRGEVMTGEKEK